MESTSHPHIRPIIAGLMLSMFLVALDGTIVSTAMPTIAGELKGFSLYAWVPSIYLLTQSVSTPIYGKLADLFGRKRILFIGIGLFLLGSITSGAAPSMLLLIVFRAVQGLGAGAVFPMTVTIIGDLFSLEQRARMQGLFSSVWGISSVLGPLVGGTLVDNIGWRWIFYLNLPFGLLAVGMIAMYFKERPVHREHSLDIAGATYLTAALCAALLLLIEGGASWPWISVQSGVLAAIGIAGLTLFFREEQRAPEPVLPLDLFRSRIILVSTVGSFFAGIVMISISFELPLYIQGVLGQDAVHAGLALMPMSIGWPIAASQSGKLAIRFGYRVVSVIGFVLQIAGVILLLTLGPSTPFLVASGLSFLVGVGLGVSTNPMTIAVQSAVAWARRGIATGTSMFMRSFGQVVGLAVMGSIINNVAGSIRTSSATNQTLSMHGHTLPPAVLAHIHAVLLEGIHDAFLAALVGAVIGLVVVAFLPGGSATEHEVREDEAAAPTREPVEAHGA
jgi:EmrB/QacA subfamily drug resistance transporter